MSGNASAKWRCLHARGLHLTVCNTVNSNKRKYCRNCHRSKSAGDQALDKNRNRLGTYIDEHNWVAPSWS